MTWEEQRRFPLKVATTLSQQFASHGLQFFKVNRTVTHVSVARPHFLDLEATPVSEGVKKIVDYINAHPKCTRRKLIETLAPTPATPVAAPAPVVPAAPVVPVQQGTEGTSTPAATPAAVPPAVPVVEASPEQAALVGDLHWLIHQGHVIEYANGILDTAKRPIPKPAKPEKQPEPAPASGETSPAADAPVPATAMETQSNPPGNSDAAPAAPAESAPVTEAAPSVTVEEVPVAATAATETQLPATAPEGSPETVNKLA
jgi:hypothetical protein